MFSFGHTPRCSGEVCQKTIMSLGSFLLVQSHPRNFAHHGKAAIIILREYGHCF